VNGDLEAARRNRERIAQSRSAEKEAGPQLPAVVAQEEVQEPPVELEPVQEVPAAPAPEEPVKMYYCKKCSYSTPDRYKLVSHYSSEHSWWHREPEPAAEEQLKFGLGLLRDDVIKAFTQDLATGRNRQGELHYGISEYDVYIEALCERNDLKSIAKMLYHWIKYLDALPDCQHTRGAKLALLSLAELCSTIGKMEPED